MPLFVKLKSYVVGLPTVGVIALGSLALGACGNNADKDPRAASEITNPPTTTTTTIPIPPTTALGSYDSYDPPPSWPTEPGLGDASKVDVSYVQHVVDAYAAVEGLSIDALVAAGKVDEEVERLIVEYSYDEEVVEIEKPVAEKHLVENRGKLRPGRIDYRVNEVTSVSPNCFVAQVTANEIGIRLGAKPSEKYIWMGIPPDDRPRDVTPSPWRLLGIAKEMKLDRSDETTICDGLWDS